MLAVMTLVNNRVHELRLPNWLRPARAEKMNFLIATCIQNREE